jgi:RimJ/RimL family protein N-acetyltransferase
MRRAHMEGELIYLRPFERADITDRYLDWMNDRASSPFLIASRLPVVLEDLERYFEQQVADSTSYLFAVCSKETDEHIGNARLYNISWIDREAIFGWLIGDKNARGKGYGSDTLIQLLRFGFHNIGLHRIYGKVGLANNASIGSTAKVGLVQEGVLRQSIFANGRFHDAAILGMLRPEFDQHHGAPEKWTADFSEQVDDSSQ